MKDVVGPKGHVSIVPKVGAEAAASDDVDGHTKTNALLVHSAELDENDNFVNEDQWISMADEPGHDELCQCEQELFLKAIVEDLDVTDLMDSAYNTFRLTMAADQSIREGRVVDVS